MASRSKRPPIYLRAARLVDPATGQEVSALIPATKGDQDQIARRGVKINQVVRTSLTRPRSLINHRMAHALGGLVVEHIEGFEECDYHEAIKKLQRESGVGCEQLDIEVPGVGTLRVNQPHSIAFDEMDESEFVGLLRGLCRHIATAHWPSMTPEQVEDMVQLMPGEVAA